MRKREAIAGDILTKAGLNESHDSYNRKFNHLYRLGITDEELALLADFPQGVLKFLFFSGNLFREQRGAFLEGLSGMYEDAPNWLQKHEVGEHNLRNILTGGANKKDLQRWKIDPLQFWIELAQTIYIDIAVDKLFAQSSNVKATAKRTNRANKKPKPGNTASTTTKLDSSTYDWQKRALKAWTKQKGRGIIVAATGTGKTYVGGTAIQNRVRAGKTAVVIVPTQALATQWRNELTDRFPGLVGSAKSQEDIPFANGALIEIFTNTLLGHESGLMLQNILSQHPKTLLVADECHHLGSQKLGQRLLERNWYYALGLTATLERSDGNIAAIESGIGDICYRYGVAEGIRDGSLAEFDLVECAIKLSPADRVEYDERDEKYKSAINRFRKVYDPDRELTGGQLIAKANSVNNALGGMLLGARNNRREYVASHPGKVQALQSLALHQCKPKPRALLFAETMDMSKLAAEAATNRGFRVESIDHTNSTAEREAVLKGFSSGVIAGISGPKILDEGINLPSADLGIILARTYSSVQMVQRFGRVLRRTPDKQRATIIVMYFQDTFEDLSHRDADTSDVWSELRQAARNHLSVSGETLQQILDRLD